MIYKDYHIDERKLNVTRFGIEGRIEDLDLPVYGDSWRSFTKAFQVQVDCYLESCSQLGISPLPPEKKTIEICLSREDYSKLSEVAQSRKISVGSLIEAMLSNYVQHQRA